MRQLLILSGKGGTGKTTIAGAFIKLSDAKAYADCDVDVPNLHLITTQTNKAIQKDYYGFKKSIIDRQKCVGCGICFDHCRFNAMKKDGEKYKVDILSCEGCGVCEFVCPEKAVTMVDQVAGNMMLYKNGYVFSTAQLKMGNGTSGKLVAEVKKDMKENVKNAEFAIIDGSPGIGCPVIASLSGVDMVLIVAEPSVSGISDMERIITTAQNFQTKIAICINKFDTNKENTKKIQDFCKDNNFSYVGEIPYDKKVVDIVNSGKSIVDVDCLAKNAVTEIFEKTLKILLED